jgi:polyhydroxyalkanoate synthase
VIEQSLVRAVTDRMAEELAALAARGRNTLEYLAGTPQHQVVATQKDLVWSRDKVMLYRYRGKSLPRRSTPILLVMSLVTRPYVFDLLPGSSLVDDLLCAGYDVYLLDWGIPDAVESHNTLETYCEEYFCGFSFSMADADVSTCMFAEFS